MKIFSFLAFLAFFGLSTSLYSIEACSSSISQNQKLKAFQYKNNEFLLNVSELALQEQDITQEEETNGLNDLEEFILNYSKDIPGLEHLPSRFETLKLQINEFKKTVYQKIEEYKKSDLKMSDTYTFMNSRYLFTYFGLKPVTLEKRNNRELDFFKTICPSNPDFELLDTQIDLNALLVMDFTLAVNKNPIFPIKYIVNEYKKNYPEKFNISPELDDKINNDSFLSRENYKKLNLGCNGIFDEKSLIKGLMFGLLPLSYGTKESTCYQAFVDNIDRYNVALIPGKAMLDDKTNYSTLYGYFIEYIHRSIFGSKFFIREITWNVLSSYDCPAYYHELETLLKFNAETAISEKMLYQTMNTLLHYLKENHENLPIIKIQETSSKNNSSVMTKWMKEYFKEIRKEKKIEKIKELSRHLLSFAAVTLIYKLLNTKYMKNQYPTLTSLRILSIYIPILYGIFSQYKKLDNNTHFKWCQKNN